MREYLAGGFLQAAFRL